MGDQKWSTASLRLSSRRYPPEEITRLVELDPNQSYPKGSLTSPSNPKSWRRDTNVWILESGLGTEMPLVAHIAGLLDRVEPALLTGLGPEVEAELFCGLSLPIGQSTLVLEASLLKRVSDCRLDLVLDIYVTEEDQAES